MILFVFHLDVLVVRLEGIAMCSYCGFHALQVGSGGCAMRICVGRAGCLFWVRLCGGRTWSVNRRGVESMKKSPDWSSAGFSLVVVFLVMVNPTHSARF